jgi:hypothetical protein
MNDKHEQNLSMNLQLMESNSIHNLNQQRNRLQLQLYFLDLFSAKMLHYKSKLPFSQLYRLFGGN